MCKRGTSAKGQFHQSSPSAYRVGLIRLTYSLGLITTLLGQMCALLKRTFSPPPFLITHLKRLPSNLPSCSMTRCLPVSPTSHEVRGLGLCSRYALVATTLPLNKVRVVPRRSYEERRAILGLSYPFSLWVDAFPPWLAPGCCAAHSSKVTRPNQFSQASLNRKQ